MRQTRFGVPAPRSRSAVTALVIEPTLGYRTDQPPTDLPPGASPEIVNFMCRNGALQPRPTLSQHTGNPNPMGVTVIGGTEVQSSTGSRYVLTSGTSRLAWYSASSYSPTSQVSAGGAAFVAWSATTYDKADFCQIYEPVNDEMLAFVSTTSSYNTLVCWKSAATIFSVVTQAPRARWIAPFDNFVMAGNIRDVGSAQSKYIQRIQWSDRGNPFNWTTGLSGFQDLLDARGGVQRIIPEESRLVIFMDYDIFIGVRDNFPNTFRFSRLDGGVGTPYGKTCVSTPRGIIFLSRDFQVYLLPKDGGPAQPIGEGVRPYLQDNLAYPENAHATYDPQLGQYQLYHTLRGGTSILPQRSLFLDVMTGAWSLQRWDLTSPRNIASSWVGALATGQAGLTWSDLSGTYTWSTLPYSWAQMGPTNDYGQQVTFLGSSDGTVWYLNSTGTNDDGTEREARWVSHGFWGEMPETQKVVNGFRVDYSAAQASTISVSLSRDQGATYDSAFTVALSQANNQMAGRGYPYTLARYPMFKVTTTDSNLDLHRFWVAGRIGGR